MDRGDVEGGRVLKLLVVGPVRRTLVVMISVVLVEVLTSILMVVTVLAVVVMVRLAARR